MDCEAQKLIKFGSYAKQENRLLLILIDWNSLTQTIGSAGIVIGVFGWLCKSIINTFLNKDLDRHKAELQSQTAQELERLRNSLQIEAAKRTFQFTALHDKRAEVIADLYSHLVEIQKHLMRIQFQYQHREIREDIDRRYYRDKRGEWELEPGIDTLDPEEQQRIDEANACISEFQDFFQKHRIYFPAAVCGLIDRFSTLASYQATAYHNVALKDENGDLLVNPRVKEVWDTAVETAPQVLSLLEIEFRSLLGIGIAEPAQEHLPRQ